MIRIDNPEKIFFTSDMHFGQQGILLFNKRPFLNPLDMDKHLISYWNEVVPTDGLVYVLGDIGENSDERIKEIFDQLNGEKILIKGNHEDHYTSGILEELFENIYDLLEIEVFDKLENTYQKIVMCHYPMFDWNDFYNGSIHLFGHLHTRNIPEFETIKSRLFAQQYDVGVDGNNFRPISYSQVKAIINQQKNDSSFKQSNYY